MCEDYFLGTSSTNMEAQEIFVLQFHLNLVSREREWSILSSAKYLVYKSGMLHNYSRNTFQDSTKIK